MVSRQEITTDNNGSLLPAGAKLDFNPDYSEQGSTSERARPRLLLLALLTFIAGFFLSVTVIRRFIGDPLRLYTPDLSEKTYMLEHLPPEPTAAFGSSMTQNGFDPRVFDSSLRFTSIAGHSINLGLSAGTQSEERLIANYYLRHLPSSVKPCLLMFEVNAAPRFALKWMEHPREINEFDLDSAELANQMRPWPATRMRFLHEKMAILVTLSLHYLNVGMLSNLFFRPDLRMGVYRYETEQDRRGLDNPPPNASSRSDVADAFAHRPPEPAAEQKTLGKGNLLILEDVHSIRPTEPIRFVEYVLPTLEDLYTYPEYPPSAHTSFGAVPIINLARPDLYPEFYSPDLWFDRIHLSAAGAQLVSAELAHQLRIWYSLHPPASNPGCEG